MKSNVYLTVIILVFQTLGDRVILCDYDEDTWMEPNAWDREHGNLGTGSVSNCPKCEAGGALSDEAMALVYYKKFIATLFNREKLQIDELSGLYQRSLVFTILPTQLDKLDQLNDPRDLDAVLSEIYANARTPIATPTTKKLSNFALILDILKDLAQLWQSSEMKFFTVVLVVILIGWYLHRRHNLGIVTMIAGFLLIFGYFYTYIECNRKMAFEEMVEAIEAEMPPEPSAPRWYTPLVKYFTSDEPIKQIQREKIKKSSKIRMGFCRPDHVLMMYANELFLKQLEFLLEKCTSTLISLKGSLSFPFNYIAGGMLLAMIAYIIKLTFKYILSPRAWASLLHRPYYPPPHQQQHLGPPTTSGVAAITEDRLSGENLTLLLNAIGAPNIVVNNNGSARPHPVSGVEEILERLETPATPTSSSSSKTNSPEKSTEKEVDQFWTAHNNKDSSNPTSDEEDKVEQENGKA